MGGFTMGSLPSIFDLNELGREAVRSAVANRVAGPACRGDVESWDLLLFGEGFELLTCDPFSFWGDFNSHGLISMAVNLLAPMGFENSSAWIANPDATEFHTNIEQMARRRRSVSATDQTGTPEV
jgi:hypothetical protein